MIARPRTIDPPIVPEVCSTSCVPKVGYGDDFRYVWIKGVNDRRLASGLELGYARVSTTKQSLVRQLATLGEAGIPDERLYMDKTTGATVDRPGLAVLQSAKIRHCA
ncbi:recombinase family protein [Amycolatopsis cynarae]|uniref:Recombinase family protein n=1 Tax=Amycolatopsis cynarae TaxID=2995223 RepID=A0ABY7B6Z0_9PSEU|nr:recombinase family protein [Amycolatopsis sp. HUAS 11-8]WAL67709.1 recombinase family protein [Amycolatopsis sp. HUAS 11-8]